LKHSTARWAEEAGFCVIDGGHFATENLVVPVLAAAIAEGCTERGLALSVHATDTQTSPFKYHFRK
jgi:putative NIF3 family GTP cyclohydrolase 1 type 2